MHLESAIGHVKRGLSYQLYWYHPLWIKVLNQLKMDLQAVLQLRRLFRFLLGQGTSIWLLLTRSPPAILEPLMTLHEGSSQKKAYSEPRVG